MLRHTGRGPLTAQPQPPVAAPDKALQAVLKDLKLSTTSKNTYAQRLKAMAANLHQPIIQVVLQPQVTIPWIKQHYSEVATQKNLVTAVLASLKRMPASRKHRLALSAWLEASQQLDEQQQARLKSNAPSARQKRGYVEFAQVVKIRKALRKGSRERLMLAFYSMIPPLRCDLNRIAVLTCPAAAVDLSTALVDRVREDNFVCLPADRKRPAVLVLREFKTAGSQGVWRRTLPSSLTQEIWSSLRSEPPRRWLFATKDGEPYTAKNFSRWCCETLRKLFGRPLTLTLLRHSYLNSMDWNRLTISDQEELAAAMCHSTEMQQTYRWMKRKRPVGL